MSSLSIVVVRADISTVANAGGSVGAEHASVPNMRTAARFFISLARAPIGGSVFVRRAPTLAPPVSLHRQLRGSFFEPDDHH